MKTLNPTAAKASPADDLPVRSLAQGFNLLEGVRVAARRRASVNTPKRFSRACLESRTPSAPDFQNSP